MILKRDGLTKNRGWKGRGGGKWLLVVGVRTRSSLGLTRIFPKAAISGPGESWRGWKEKEERKWMFAVCSPLSLDYLNASSICLVRFFIRYLEKRWFHSFLASRFICRCSKRRIKMLKMKIFWIGFAIIIIRIK